MVGCSFDGIVSISGAAQTWFCNTLATRLRCISTAPLDRPVVPPVYCSTAMSSLLMAGFFSVAGVPRATASLKRTAPGRLNGGTSFLAWRTT